MTGQTLGRLWSRYLKARQRLEKPPEGDPSTAERREPERRESERRANQLRDRLIVNYSPLVKYVASRISSRTTGALGQEDLISWGVVGLMDAVETYDPGRNTKFESYAISKIRWAILDELRKEDWVPRRVRVRAQEVDRATNRLNQRLRRAPTEEEVAEELGISLAEYRGFLDQYSRSQLSSLEARLDVGGSFGGVEVQALIVDRTAADPQSEADMKELRAQLVGAMGTLEEQERLVATFYFYDGLTLKEIGKALDLTEGRISQILRRALLKLRERLGDGPLASGG